MWRLVNVHGVTFHYPSQIRQLWYGRIFTYELLKSSILGVQDANLCICTFGVQNAIHLYNYLNACVLLDLCLHM